MSAFVSWNKQFYTWLANRPFGKQEVAQSNNYGTFADMQLAAIAQFKAGATTIANAAKSERIDVQTGSARSAWILHGREGAEYNEGSRVYRPAASGTANWTYPELEFTQYAASDIVHTAADAGDKAAAAAVSKLATPPKGDLWAVRPAAEQLDSIAG